jgi:dTDP-4-dehydrorhamnose reductase
MSLPETRFLVTGASGQVGGDLVALLQSLGTVIAPTRSELDLADGTGIRRFVSDSKPHWIINPGAYTAVDKAESEPGLAHAINAEAPRALGEVGAQLGIPVIHFSTDYVFNGEGTKPWVEDDATGPLGVYGASKLAGERALAASGAAHLIFRTSWVYSGGGKNFLLTILRLAQQKDELRIVDDQHGAPTWSQDLARLVVHVIRKTSETSSTGDSSVQGNVRAVQGIYHAAGRGETTWFGFAREFLRVAAKLRPEAKFARLVPIATNEFPTPARRPANSRLDCAKLSGILDFSMPTWQESAAAVVEAVIGRLPG